MVELRRGVHCESHWVLVMEWINIGGEYHKLTAVLTSWHNTYRIRETLPAAYCPFIPILKDWCNGRCAHAYITIAWWAIAASTRTFSVQILPSTESHVFDFVTGALKNIKSTVLQNFFWAFVRVMFWRWICVVKEQSDWKIKRTICKNKKVRYCWQYPKKWYR